MAPTALGSARGALGTGVPYATRETHRTAVGGDTG